MEGNDLSKLLDSLGQKSIKDEYDYAGYAVVDNLKLTRKDVKEAVEIMWSIVMTMDTTQRENKYLFSKGLIRSKDIFLAQKEKVGELTDDQKKNFDFQANIFKERLENSKPLVEFLIKIRELI